MGVKNLVGLAEALLQSPGLELKELELGPATLLRLKLTKTMENIFSRLEGKVVVLDEVQELVSPAFLKLLKTMWDTSRGLRLIFTGSYAGVLKRMLEPGKGSPLYGRQPARIELKPFNKDLAEEFLRLGFAEYRMSPRESEIREAVERLGGAVGWLTYYGNSRCVRRMGHEGV
jgi:AAA+ ATPase superfamily predicted ATPase